MLFLLDASSESESVKAMLAGMEFPEDVRVAVVTFGTAVTQYVAFDNQQCPIHVVNWNFSRHFDGC